MYSSWAYHHTNCDHVESVIQKLWRFLSPFSCYVETVIIFTTTQYFVTCCSGYNHPPKFYLSFILEPTYQHFIVACLDSSSTQASVIFLQIESMSIKSCDIPLIGSFIRLGLAIGWVSPLRNCTNVERNHSSLQKFAQFFLGVYWAP